MVFSSHLFLFYFLPLTLLLYYVSPRKSRHLVLTLSSYAFYGWANPLFVILMLFSTLIDYFCGRGMEQAEKRGGPTSPGRKLALMVSLVSNLGLLGFFKYFNFFMDSVNGIMALAGAGELVSNTLAIALPLGISFYTFQSMSYTIDLYRGKVKVMHNFIDFACYVSLFPQLVAGPIIRFSELADQLENRSHSMEKFSRGFVFLALGLAKKVLLANPCGKVADLAFGSAGLDVLGSWYGIIAYAFQIYFDFSGYSDMAIGLGLMLGFVFPKNFDSPYISRSITEFWRRWHLSLSFWLRDYLYIPLGGNRKGSFRTTVNLMAVMLLGGLWHGASWNFVIWGGLHGLLLMIERITSKRGIALKIPSILKMLVTFVLVLITWVFFRADSLAAALNYLSHMFGLGTTSDTAFLIDRSIYNPWYLLSFAVSAAVTWFGVQSWDWSRHINPIKALFSGLIFVLSILILASQDFNPFIYFIF